MRNHSKTRGLGAGRKLRIHRREQRWADKDFNKANLGSEWKKPFAGCSHAKGIVLEKIGIEAKQPNSAIRKCVRVQLIKNGKKIAAFVPRDGCLNFTDENDEVLIAGFGRKGHAVGDIPGVRFKVVKVAGVSLNALFREKKVRRRFGSRALNGCSPLVFFETEMYDQDTDAKIVLRVTGKAAFLNVWTSFDDGMDTNTTIVRLATEGSFVNASQVLVGYEKFANAMKDSSWRGPSVDVISTPPSRRQHCREQC